MKRKHVTTLAFCAAMLCVLGAFLIGCELFQPNDVDDYFDQNPYPTKGRDKENPGDLTIDPTAATVEWIGEKVVFTVEGGNETFKWRVADSDQGSIKRMDNDRQAVYKCKSLEPNTVIAEDANGRTVAAPINTVIADLRIVPSGPFTVSWNAGSPATIGLLAVGGLPPYEWKVTFSDLGTITSTSGPDDENAVYTDESGGSVTGRNVIVVIDSGVETAEATVFHTLP
ncbi:MAG: hypothetical protein HQ559_05155 [Lentisphaerae bacterium]|nr:hypothetical protein [Lentisphaerota bacterium]